MVRRTLPVHLARTLNIEIARRFFLDFARFVFPGLLVNHHHVKMAQKLDALRNKEIFFLMMALPPRHTKSLFCSILYPAFWLGHNPEKQIIHSSYAAALSNSFSLQVRAMVRDSEQYKILFPHMALSPERQRLDDWKLVTGGGFKSIGVGGGITGHGADLFIIDDPHKEGDEKSPTQLQAVFDWWTSAARTRLSPGAAVLFPMTRWAPRDLAGRQLEIAEHDRKADQWELLRLPAIAEKKDPLGRKRGTALWPERYSLEALLKIRAISERYFEALFQQNPQITDQPLFKLDDFVRSDVPVVGEIFWTVDLASTIQSRADYTVFGRWSWYRNTLALLEGYRFRATWSAVKKELKSLIYKFPDENWYFPKHSLELIAVQTLRDEMPTQRHRIRAVLQSDPKYERALPLSDIGKSGKLIVCRGEFGDLFVRELCGFPDELGHDDMVDMSSVATHALKLHTKFFAEILKIEKSSKGKNPYLELIR